MQRPFFIFKALFRNTISLLVNLVEGRFHAHVKDKTIGSTFKAVQTHLDSAGVEYLNAINGTTPESLLSTVQRLSSLARYLPEPDIIASVGVGQGEEIHALSELFQSKGTRILGVDISTVALRAARERVQKNYLPVEFILGNAINLPFSDESIDGIVLSSILHEIYSYLPRGLESWETALKEAARVLAPHGCLFLRDPAAPEYSGQIQITFNTDFAHEFYNYFRKNYRVFADWDAAASLELIGSYTDLVKVEVVCIPVTNVCI